MDFIEFLIWFPYSGSLFGLVIWIPYSGSLFRFLIWVPYLGSLFRFLIWASFFGSLFWFLNWGSLYRFLACRFCSLCNLYSSSWRLKGFSVLFSYESFEKLADFTQNEWKWNCSTNTWTNMAKRFWTLIVGRNFMVEPKR